MSAGLTRLRVVRTSDEALAINAMGRLVFVQSPAALAGMLLCNKSALIRDLPYPRRCVRVTSELSRKPLTSVVLSEPTFAGNITAFAVYS